MYNSAKYCLSFGPINTHMNHTHTKLFNIQSQINLQERSLWRHLVLVNLTSNIIFPNLQIFELKKLESHNCLFSQNAPLFFYTSAAVLALCQLNPKLQKVSAVAPEPSAAALAFYQ